MKNKQIKWHMYNLEMQRYVTQFAKTGHNSAFTEIHFIAPSRFGH